MRAMLRDPVALPICDRRVSAVPAVAVESVVVRSSIPSVAMVAVRAAVVGAGHPVAQEVPEVLFPPP